MFEDTDKMDGLIRLCMAETCIIGFTFLSGNHEMKSGSLQ